MLGRSLADEAKDAAVASHPQILLVDGQPVSLRALELVLEEVPATLVRASSGAEALALARRRPFALAIVDVRTPGVEDAEFAPRLLQGGLTAGVPVIFVGTAEGDDARRFWSAEAGAVDYLPRPLDATVLLGKVRVFLELARTRSALESVVLQRTRALRAKAEELSRRNQVKSILSEVARDVSGGALAATSGAVTTALARVGRFLGASWAELVFGTPEGGVPTGPGLGWFPEGARPFGTGEVSFSTLLAAVDVRGVMASRDVLPPWADATRDALAAHGVASLLLLPIVEAQRVVGAVVFVWSNGPEKRPPELEDLPEQLGLLPEILHGALSRARAEAQQARSEAQYRLLFETMAQGVVYQNAAGEIIAANPAAEEILGVRLEEMLGSSPSHPRWRPIFEDGLPFPAEAHPAVQALRTGETVDGVTMGLFNAADGDYRWVELRAVPLFHSGEAAPFQVTLTLADQTALRRARREKEQLAQLEASSRARGRFFASMSHEIRTPLNAILGYAQVLLHEAGLGSKQRDGLETIERSGRHLMSLVNNVLDMARLEAGRDGLDVEGHDFEDLLTDVERMFRLRATEKGLEFKVLHAAGAPRRLRLDAGKVRQVLINLLGNAMKFTPVGSVVLRAAVTPGASGRVRVRFEVQDSGVGIPADRLEEIFEPFVQIAHTASSPSQGTGLGLTVSRRYAQLMGGDVSVESLPGVGSTFRFDFDAERDAEGEADTLRPRVVGLAAGSPVTRLLLVSPDARTRGPLAMLLREVGLVVEEAEAVTEALAAFDREPYALVLATPGQLGGDAGALAARLRALPGGASTRVALLTPDATAEVRERAIASGLDDVLGAGSTEDEVFALVSRLTGARFSTPGTTLSPSPMPSPASRHPLSRPLPPPSSVPEPLRASLRTALERGAAAPIAQAIDAIAAEAPGVGAELRRLAEGFDYQRLLDFAGGAS